MVFPFYLSKGGLEITSGLYNRLVDRLGKLPLSATRVRFARGLYFGVVCTFALVSIGFGISTIRGDQALLVSRTLIGSRPVESFQWNIRAYNKSPWSYQTRLNMLLTLQAVLNLPEKDARIQVRLSEKVADWAYGLSSSASPHHAYILLLRFNYLLRTGRDASAIAEELENHTYRAEVRRALEIWKDMK